MMLLANDLLHYKEPTPRTLRVLWVSPIGAAVTIDSEEQFAIPTATKVDVLIDDLKQGRAELLKSDPYLVIANDDDLSEARKDGRNAAWELIKNLVQQQPDIYVPSKRAELVNGLVLAKVSTRVTIYAHLRRFWQRGMTRNALLPDYDNCGAPGEIRCSTEGVKRGRPRKFGDQPGVNVTDDVRKIFQISVDRYLSTSEKFSRHEAFKKMITDFFCDKTLDEDTDRIITSPKGSLGETGFPTYGEYSYWVDPDGNPLDLKRKRMSARRYDKDCRGLLGTSAAETWGPGSRYQIDATIADVFLVSRFNRKKIIGRPVLYIIIDVFSRMIVGVYIGLEGPSWVAAMMALSNTSADKVAFCGEFGRKIAPHLWPCHHLPATFLGDKGEIEAAKIDTLANNFNVTIETAQAYRADWKGVVERRFRLLPAAFKPYVPGYIDVDYRARGGKDYRLDARLNLFEFAQIIIECILYYNNFHEISRYDKDRAVAADGVPAIPIELWNWGIEHTSGRLRSFDENQVRFALMPIGQAAVTVFGLRFMDSYYSCAKAIEERWFDRARQEKSWRVNVSYDPRTIDRIYLHDAKDPLKYQVCTLTDRSRAHRDLSLWEVGQQIDSAKHDSANRLQDQQLAASDLIANIERIVDQAGSNDVEPNSAGGGSAASLTKNIRTQRAEEKQANRASEAFNLGGGSTDAKPTAQIVLFPGAGRGAPDYSEPDIADLMNAEETADE